MSRLVRWWRRFTHDRLGWGYAETSIGFDGCSATSRCVLCGGRLLMDSNGDWFHVGEAR